MSDSTVSLSTSSQRSSVMNSVDMAAKQVLFRTLNNIRTGSIHLVDSGRSHTFGRTDQRGLCARLEVHNPEFYWRTLFGGSLGAAEAYVRGQWSSDQLVDLFRIVASDAQLLDGSIPVLSKLMRPVHGLIHCLRRNTRSGSQRNITAHYDLSNEFYKLFLDENMMYSSAVFPTEDSTLEHASRFKNDLICRKLQLKPEDKILEIGSGWGGFAIHAAMNYGCHITTTTISDAQFDLANERVRKSGLQDRVSVIKNDYRDLSGCYDKIVSIEMIEAVGHQYFDTYFRKCSELLKPCGSMLLQAITITDQHFERHAKTVDFIKRHIFPGSCLPSVTRICHSLSDVTDLHVQSLRDIGMDYARTLGEWSHRFVARLEEVRALGFSDEFIRKWRFYLAYCEAGFRERHISNVQMLLTKPQYESVPSSQECQVLGKPVKKNNDPEDSI